MARPTKSMVDKKVVEYEKYFNPWRRAADDYNRFYRLDFHVPHHEDWDEFLTGSAKRIVDDAVDSLALDFPTITFYNPAGTLKGEERSENLELVIRSVWEQSDTEAAIPVRRAVANDLFRIGMGCVKVLLDYSRWPDEKGKTQDEKEYLAAVKALVSPLVIRRVNPTSVLFDPMEDASNPSWIIEQYYRSGASIKQKFPRLNLKDIQDEDKILWTEYWDKEWRAFYADDREIATIAHRWGFAPYVIGYSGYGIDLGANIENPDLTGVVSERATPILYPVRSLLRAESELLTQIVTMGASAAYNSPVIKSPNPEEAIKRVKFSPGLLTGITSTEDLLWPPLPPGLGQLYQNLQIIRDLIQEATYPSAVLGRRQPGTTSGYDRALVVGTARLKFGAPLAALNHSGTRICAMLARLFETMDESLNIYGRSKDGSPQFKSISPDIVKHFYFCKFELKPNAPEDEDRKLFVGMQLLSSQKFDEFPIMEKYFGITNPRENMVKRTAQQILAQVLPILSQRFAQQVLMAGQPPPAVAAPESPPGLEGGGLNQPMPTSLGPDGQPVVRGQGNRPAPPGSPRELARSMAQRLAVQPAARIGRPPI